MAKVEAVLLALRKSSTVPADAKGEVGVDEARTLFGVDEIGAFRKLISDFGMELNQKVRTNPEFKAELAVDQATERQYFGVPAMPDDLKSILESVPPIVNARLGDEFINVAIGESEGEVELAQQLLDAADPGEGNPKGRKVLVKRIEAAVISAERVLVTLKKSDLNSVVKLAATILRDAEAKIRELNGYDDDAAPRRPPRRRGARQSKAWKRGPLRPAR